MEDNAKVVGIIIAAVGLIGTLSFLLVFANECPEFEDIKELSYEKGIYIGSSNNLLLCEHNDWFNLYNLSETGKKECHHLKSQDSLLYFYMKKGETYCKTISNKEYCFQWINVENEFKVKVSYEKCDFESKFKETFPLGKK